MGTERSTAEAWEDVTVKTSSKSRAEIFTGSRMNVSLNPKGVIRESCDSEANPASTPAIIAVDVTGSMGELAEIIVRKGLGTVMNEVYSRKPIHDPHIMLMAIGDAYYDSAPLQVTQFEASVVLAEQLGKFYLEGGGGANAGESYHLAWYFAALKVKADSMIKRGKKGYLFTVGDEPPLPTLTKEHIKAIFGDNAQADISTTDLLSMVSENWEVFHLLVKPGTREKADRDWSALLGQRCIPLSDHTKLAEVIVSTMQVVEGQDVDTVVKSWSGDTSLVVANAVNALTKGSAAGTAVTRF